MKKYIKYIRQMAYGSALCVALWACSKMNELSDRFLNTGEAVYAAKVDSVLTYTGYKKVEVKTYISIGRIDTVKVYYNDYQDCVDIPVNNRSGVFSKVIEGLDERAYIFNVVSVDSYGNKSLPVEVQGIAFGDDRLNLIKSISRNIVSAIYDNTTNEVTVKWGGAVENSSGCLLTYTNTSDQPDTLTVPPSETVTVIPDWKSGLRSSTQFVVGEGNMAETFSTEPVSQGVYKEVLPKTGWSAEASSFHDSPRQSSAAIDNNPMQPWHSSAGGQSMPQWIILNFNNAVQIDGIVFQQRIDDINDRAFPYRIKWEASNDKSNWTTILESLGLEYPTVKDVPNPLWLPCTTPTTAQYLRCTISETWPVSRGYTYIGELGIYQILE
ncbi:MAG: discoidin domain-containing protein [Prevotellaceae bacterium]|jgi:hypothetical protein|nr:discoidin domain-containing protein [Prevotellaceae bacterium]